MKYWNARLKKMSEYVPGEQPVNLSEFIKLNTNENPFPPPASVTEAMRKACDESIRRYPSPTSLSAREAFAKEHALGVENVMLGNGSDEIFTLLFRGFIEPKGLAAFPYPSYSLYYTLAEANGIKYEKLPLTASLDVNLDEYLKKPYDLVIIGNPNNPTGRGVEVKAIRAFLGKFAGLLVVDEAYVDFYGETAIGLVADFDNIIVTRSLSKSCSLAGMRVGFAAASKEIIQGLLKLKDSYNIDRVAEAAARAAILDRKGVAYNISMLRSNKEYLEERLADMDFEVVPSKANFLFVRHPSVPAADLFEQLKERKILVRYFTGPVQGEYVRITVGTMMEIKTLVKELGAIVTA